MQWMLLSGSDQPWRSRCYGQPDPPLTGRVDLHVFYQLFPSPRVLMSEQNDEVLVKRCMGGDRGAFEVLVGKYQGPLFNLALRMTQEYLQILSGESNHGAKLLQERFGKFSE